MRVVSADSGAAILDQQFKPTHIVASASVLIEPPFREPSGQRLAEPIFREVDGDFDVIVHEAELCLRLLETANADVVHLDMSLGGVTLEELSPVELISLRASKAGRQRILKILPRLRKIAAEIKRLHGIEVLAIGKESVPVRIAELTVAAEAVLFASEKVLEEQQEVLLGLPHNCRPAILEDRIYMHSLIAGEHDLRSWSFDSEKVLTKVKLTETLNPVARGFRALKIAPK